MGRLTRKQRANIVWPTFLKRCEGKSFIKVALDLHIYEELHGEIPLLYYLEMFKRIKMEWVANTHVRFRNDMLMAVRSTLGKGAAEELQRISNKRTF